MRYSRWTSNYQERITLSYHTHMMSMTDLVAIGVETLRIDNVNDSGSIPDGSYEIFLSTKLIQMNP